MLRDKNLQPKAEPLSRQDFLGMISGVGAATVTAGLASAAKPGQLDAPSLSYIAPGRGSIELQILAGSSGAPGGFAIQWMSSSDFTSNNSQWLGANDDRLETAIFPGAPFALAGGGSNNVKIGDLTFVNGVTSTHVYALKPREYVFRAFALAANRLNQSDASVNVFGGPLVPPAECTDPNCTRSLAYWASNGPGKCSLNAGPNLWPALAQPFTLGSREYDATGLCRILLKTGDEFGVNALAKQLIAARLNVAHGAASDVIADSLASADALIGNLLLPVVGKDGFPSTESMALVIALTNYNEGDTGPLTCCF